MTPLLSSFLVAYCIHHTYIGFSDLLLSSEPLPNDRLDRTLVAVSSFYFYLTALLSTEHALALLARDHRISHSPVYSFTFEYPSEPPISRLSLV